MPPWRNNCQLNEHIMHPRRAIVWFRNDLRIHDNEALTEALRRLLADRELRERFRAAARQTIETRYSFAGRMAKLRDLYDAMLTR